MQFEIPFSTSVVLIYSAVQLISLTMLIVMRYHVDRFSLPADIKPRLLVVIFSAGIFILFFLSGAVGFLAVSGLS